MDGWMGLLRKCEGDEDEEVESFKQTSRGCVVKKEVAEGVMMASSAKMSVSFDKLLLSIRLQV